MTELLLSKLIKEYKTNFSYFIQIISFIGLSPGFFGKMPSEWEGQFNFKKSGDKKAKVNSHHPNPHMETINFFSLEENW